MPNTELRAPRRKVEKETDWLIPILIGIIVIGGLGYMVLKNIDRSQTNAALEESDRANSEMGMHDAESARQRQILQQRQQAAQMRQSSPSPAVTTESGRRYEVPGRTQNNSGSDEISTAERYRRASRIMESNRPQTPSYSTQTQNEQLRIANTVCTAILPQGSIAYRQCRAEQWHRLRNGCIQRRQQLNMMTGTQYTTLNASAQEWCTAESQYRIVDQN